MKMESRIHALEKTVKLLFSGLVVMLILSLVLIILVTRGKSENQVLRARGIVLVDKHGNERILIGAPIPYAKNRVRTDTARVRKLWGEYFPEEYMEWYQAYEHATNGILVLDENGYDRLALGAPTPDPNIGKRIGPATGIMINDQEGFERSGYALIHTAEGNRVVLGLDNEDGTEGLSLALFEDGTTGFIMNGPGKKIFLGRADSAGLLNAEEVPFYGLMVQSDSTLLFNSGKPDENPTKN